MGLDRQCGLGIRKAVSPQEEGWGSASPAGGSWGGGRLGGEVAARSSVAREHPGIYLVHIMLI